MEQVRQIINNISSFFEQISSIDSPIPAAFTAVIRLILPILAVIILFRCTKSLLRGRQEPEVWAFMGLPNGSRASLFHWENVIGRAKTSDVVLNYPTLSRSHCAVIRNEKGQWTAIDLESKGGVYLNGEQIEGSRKFHEGDILTMGGVDLALKELDPDEVREQSSQRTKPGRFVKPSGTFFFITIFQVLLCLQHCISAGGELTAALPLSFLALTGMMWGYFLFFRSLRRTGFEVESLAFFMSSIGLSVVATDSPGELMKQVVLLAAGLLGFIIICGILRNLNRANKLRWPISILGIGVLGFGYLLSSVTYGARNWIDLGGITLQPSEFVKIAFVFAGAATLDRLFAKRNLILFVGYTGVCLGVLALMSDFGTAVVFFAVFLVIAYLRSGDLSTVVLSIAAAAFGIFLILTVKPYVAERFSSWGRVWEDPYGKGMQQVLTMASVASGGFFGLGAGNGVLHNVAAADTDLVFGLVTEELGLIIGLCIIAAIVVMSLFTVKTAATARSSFYVIAAGASVTIMMTQLILNIFGSLDIIPFTGVTLPFVSKGGSSLISCWCILAFVKAVDTRQNASFATKLRKKTRKKRAEEVYDDEEYEDDYYEDEESDYSRYMDDDDFNGQNGQYFEDDYERPDERYFRDGYDE